MNPHARETALQPSFIALETPEKLPCNDLETAWNAATDAQRERAVKRLRAVERSEALAAEGIMRAEADGIAALECGASKSAVATWRRRARGAGRGDRLRTLLDAPGRGRPRAEWTGTAAETLWTLWRTDWLREEAPDAAAAHRRVEAVAQARGWECPPLQAFTRRVRREVSRREVVRARKGALAAMNTSPHQTRSVAGLRPLDIINGDGRRHDVLVEFPNGREGRPVAWMWQDVWSRRILAFRAGETESADLVRLALHAVITRHGVPGRILLDSTRAASAKWLTGGMRGRRRWRSADEELPGLLALLDVKFSTTAIDRDAGGRGKGRGRAKPIERAFGDLARQIDTHPLLAGAFTGRSPSDRPETHRRCAAPFADFLRVLENAVAEHNARPGRATEIAAGGSFDEAWAAGLADCAVRRLVPSQAAVLLLAAEDAKIDSAGCLRLKAGRGSGLPPNRYHHPDLVERAGSRVVARFDPECLHDGVHVFDREGRFVCRAPCLVPVGFADTEAAGAYERARRRARRAAETSLAAQNDMDALIHALDETAPPAPPAARPAAVRVVAGGGLPESVPPKPRGGGAVIRALRKIHRDEEE